MKRMAVSALVVASLSACVANGGGQQATGPQGLNLFSALGGGTSGGSSGDRIGSVGQIGRELARMGFSQDKADEAVRAVEKGFSDLRAGRGAPSGNRLCNDSRSPAAVSVPIAGGKVAVCKVVGTDGVVQIAVYGADAKGRQGKRLLGDVSNSGGGWQVSELRGS